MNSFLSSITVEQELLVDEITKHLQPDLSAAGYNITDQKNAINRIMENAEVSNSRFWLFGIDNKIVFFQDERTSEIYNGKTFSELLEEYRDKGGENLDKLSELMESQHDGSVSYTRSKNDEKEIISLSFFTVNHRHYFVGVSTTEQYFFSLTDIYRDRIYLYALIGLLCSVIFIMLFYFLLEIQGKDNKISEYFNTLQMKNRQVEELSQRNSQYNSLNTSDSLIYDQLTNVYSKQFFFAVLDNISKSKGKLPKVSVILIHLRDPRCDLSISDIKEAADILKNLTNENQIITRIEYSDFAIVLFDAALENAYEVAACLEQKLLLKLDNISADINVKDVYSLIS
jgi:GGDEF domain-containing protein